MQCSDCSYFVPAEGIPGKEQAWCCKHETGVADTYPVCFYFDKVVDDCFQNLSPSQQAICNHGTQTCNTYTVKVVPPTVSIPFKCPVCEGCGLVPCGFYSGLRNSTSVTPEKCKTCNGTGVIWK